MGSTRRSLEAQPKIIKKIIETRNQTTEKKILKKSMFNTSKVKRSQKFMWRLPDGICKLDPKSLKKLSEHQIYQSKRKFSQKKYI
jgi:hypothetical protein